MSNTELIMLGTGNAMVTRCYNTCFALRNQEEYLLVDAGGGNGILAQMEKAGIPFEKVHAMFVSHGHTDHVLGVIWVVRKISAMMKNDTYTGDFVIYCHAQLAEMIRSFCVQLLPGTFTRLFDERIWITVVEEGQEEQAAGFKLRFFDIDSTKKKQFGFCAELPDGKKLVYLGDEPFNERNRTYAGGGDWLMSEAFCLDEEKDKFKPYEKHHSTARDAGRTAQELGVQNLILYHTEDSDLKHRKERYTREAGTYFKKAIFVPDDLERILLC